MKTMLRITVALALAVLARAASAQTTNTMNLNVNANVAKACTFTWASVAGQTALLDIGTYDPTSGTDKASASAQRLNIRCNKNTQVTIALDNGQNPSGATRRMVGTNFGDFLTYGLYSSLGPNVAWPASQNYTTTSSAAKGFDFWGVITAGQDVSQDTYSDQVVISLTW